MESRGVQSRLRGRIGRNMVTRGMWPGRESVKVTEGWEGRGATGYVKEENQLWAA